MVKTAAICSSAHRPARSAAAASARGKASSEAMIGVSARQNIADLRRQTRFIIGTGAGSYPWYFPKTFRCHEPARTLRRGQARAGVFDRHFSAPMCSHHPDLNAGALRRGDRLSNKANVPPAWRSVQSDFRQPAAKRAFCRYRSAYQVLRREPAGSATAPIFSAEWYATLPPRRADDRLASWLFGPPSSI